MKNSSNEIFDNHGSSNRIHLEQLKMLAAACWPSHLNRCSGFNLFQLSENASCDANIKEKMRSLSQADRPRGEVLSNAVFNAMA